MVNVIDYFTERYNKTRSDGTKGEMKSFHVDDQLLHKIEKIENMKNLFGFTKKEDGKLEFKSFRETYSQELKKNERINKRKLNEFQFVICNINNKNLAFEIMKKHLYNKADEQSFFYALEKHLFGSQNMFTDANKIVRLILPACYFGNLDILEWLLNSGHDINIKNVEKLTGLHLGNSIYYSH